MLLDYFKQVKVELRKVTWPTKEETKNYTIIVIVVSAIVGIYLGVFDYIFSKVIELLVGR